MQINQYKIIGIFGSPLWTINNRKGHIIERMDIKKRLQIKQTNQSAWKSIFYENKKEAIADVIKLICEKSTTNKK